MIQDLTPELLDSYRAAWRARGEAEMRSLILRREEGRRLASRLAVQLATGEGVRRVWLVGSLCEGGRVHSRSDIDLLVEGLLDDRYMKVLASLYRELPAGWELDLIRFEELEEDEAATLARRGEVLV